MIKIKKNFLYLDNIMEEIEKNKNNNMITGE